MRTRQKILLIDDEPDMRLLLKFLLQPEGYEVLETGNGQEALELLGTDSIPDLIFLDHKMPVMDGPEFLKVLEEKNPEIFAAVPIILLTGSDSKEIPITRAAEVVSKPVKLEVLLQLIEKYLH